MRFSKAVAAGLLALMVLGTCAPVFADGTSVAAPPRVSYNPGAASVYHAPISSIGLVALSKSFPQRGGSAPSVQASSASPQGVPQGTSLFINDSSYAPQSETTVAVNPTNTSEVVGGYNDARYFFCPDLNSVECPDGYTESVSGFTTSADGGATVAKSNDLPGLTVTEQNLTSGSPVTSFLVSWGDPSLAPAPGGTFYFASLAIDPVTGASGVMLEKSNANLFSPSVDCSTPLTSPDSNPCWTSALVYGNMTFQCRNGACGQTSFEDKETVAVDTNPSSAYYGDVYVAWDHFYADGTSSSFLARCTPGLVCTMLSGGGSPVASGTDLFSAFSTPAVDSSGNVYITWCDFGTPTTYGPVYCSIRSSPPGGDSFGTTHSVLSFMGAGTQLAADTALIGFATEQFRAGSELTVAAGPTSDVYFAIAVCASGFYYRFNNLLTLPSDNPGDCGESAVYFVRSMDGGATWSAPTQLSTQGVEVQPTLSVDPKTNAVVLAYYTSQFDPFEHRLDVGVQVSTDGGSTFSFIRGTSVSNEPDSDPADYNYISAGGFGGSFVVPQYGDYFTATSYGGKVWVLFTGNYAKEQGTYKDSPFLAVLGETPATLSLGSNAQDAAPGDKVTYAASGFTAGSTLALSLDWNGVTLPLASATVSSGGSASGSFTVPNVQSQVYTVTATDGSGFSSFAQLGIGQVSLTPVEASLANIQSAIGGLGTSISNLGTSVTAGFGNVTSGIDSLGATVRTSSANVYAGVQGIAASLNATVTGASSTLAYIEYLTIAIFVLLVILLLLQLMRGRNRMGSQSSAPSAPMTSPVASESGSAPPA